MATNPVRRLHQGKQTLFVVDQFPIPVKGNDSILDITTVFQTLQFPVTSQMLKLLPKSGCDYRYDGCR